MLKTKVYVGDIGTKIVLDCGQDISAATAIGILAKKPGSGSTETWAAVAEGTNSIAFTSLEGTFSCPGAWLLQAQVTLPTGAWKGRTVQLDVLGAFQK